MQKVTNAQEKKSKQREKRERKEEIKEETKGQRTYSDKDTVPQT